MHHHCYNTVHPMHVCVSRVMFNHPLVYFVVGVTSKDSDKIVNSSVCIRGYYCSTICTSVHVHVQVLNLSAPNSTSKDVLHCTPGH